MASKRELSAKEKRRIMRRMQAAQDISSSETALNNLIREERGKDIGQLSVQNARLIREAARRYADAVGRYNPVVSKIRRGR